MTTEDPANLDYQLDFARALDEVAEVAATKGDLAEAEAFCRQSLAISERLAKANPNDIAWLRAFSVSNERLGAIIERRGRLDEALEQYRASLARMAPLRDADPGNNDLNTSLP